ncbi:Glutathione transferase [Marinomonas mediterranea MMB-1]|uniref:Glutathione transferase n=1 Tax=Marinomonas mediterranea (strain ATCC 700492 / JCM 21426 / NBRC 103028 / MMB-1) TaxID=717774 RepID=F2JUW0_MARM1|nr:Glutathione transferase [Marinomonas mediterranea MMB-1]
MIKKAYLVTTNLKNAEEFYVVSGLNHITLSVSDLARSLTFYVDLLGMKGHVKWDKGAYLSCGDLWLCLYCDDVSPAGDYTHIAFNVQEADFTTCRDKLRQAGVTEWKVNSSEGDSVYFLDPDGHKLEIHSGNLMSRLESLKEAPYSGLVWL